MNKTPDEIIDDVMSEHEETLDHTPPTPAVPATARPHYEAQRDKTGRYIVVRFGPKGGKRIVMTYADTEMGLTASLTCQRFLTTFASDE